jgi:flagellar biosynthesis protein FlhG
VSEKRAQFWVLTSGKGGVGKSVLALNMGIALAQTGKRVLLLDTDLGLANLHVLANVEPRGRLEHVLGREGRWEDAVTPLPWGPDLLAADNGQSLCLLSGQQATGTLADTLGSLHAHYDFVVVDTPRGISDAALRFCLACDRTVLVTSDEPTSITNTYAWFKLATLEAPELPVWLIANATSDVTLHGRFGDLCQRFLGRRPQDAGIVPADDAVPQSVSLQQPLYKSSGNGTAWHAILNIIDRLQATIPQHVTQQAHMRTKRPGPAQREG